MNEYTASNGWVITPKGQALTYKCTGNGDRFHSVTATEANALREFFRAEEDKRLGRWRYPAEPELLVYPDGEGVFVVYEGSYEIDPWTREQAMTWDGESASKRAALAYFDAHPQPPLLVRAEDVNGELVTLREFTPDHRARAEALVHLLETQGVSAQIITGEAA